MTRVPRYRLLRRPLLQCQHLRGFLELLDGSHVHLEYARGGHLSLRHLPQRLALLMVHHSSIGAALLHRVHCQLVRRFLHVLLDTGRYRRSTLRIIGVGDRSQRVWIVQLCMLFS